LLGEGRDVANLDCLFLIYPFSFEGKLVQYLGRLARNQDTKTIYDYRDEKILYFERLFKKRMAYYHKLQGKGYQIVQGQ
jgi:superfamily II DNA or RNA helicase